MHARIKCLADLFPKGNILIDIGSDHGYLGIELLRSEKAIEVWNIDLSKESLDNSKKTYEKEELDSKAKFICGDGFTKIKDVPYNSVVVVAGLGSTQILKILELMPKHVKCLILMSHTDYYPIRKWAWEDNWSIKEEIYLEERGFCYIAMKLIRNTKKREEYTELDYIFGKDNFRKSSLFRKFWLEKSKRLLRIPTTYRNKTEKEVIRFLIDANIIVKVNPDEDF